MNVLPVLDAVLARLREKLPQLQVEYFPEKPAEYRLNHPVGALLLSYAGSRFDRPDDTGAVIQSQTIQLCVTVVFRQLNGKKGAINVLDAVRRILGGHTPPGCRRRILGGHTPPGCRRRIWLTREVFIGEVRGLWQYALDFATESVFIEDSDLPSGPLLTEVNYEESE
ncbi:TPA: Gp37 family protein [Escherichia coli]|nr:Gp37 family protein [Escherichia coli]